MGWLGFKAAISSTDGKWRTQTICFSVVDQSTGLMPHSQTLALKSEWKRDGIHPEACEKGWKSGRRGGPPD